MSLRDEEWPATPTPGSPANSDGPTLSRRLVMAVVVSAGLVAAVVVVGQRVWTPQPAVPPPVSSSPAPPSAEPSLVAPECGGSWARARLPASATVDGGLQAWIDALPEGQPPTSPYWHDGVLHVNGREITAPYLDVDIQTAGRTLVLAGYEHSGPNALPSEWSLLTGAGLTPIPVPYRSWLSLSADGRFAWWQVGDESRDHGIRHVVWDTWRQTELGTHVQQPHDESGACAMMLLGIDSNGVAHLLDEGADPQITRWDVRADTVVPTDLVLDRATTLGEQFDFSWWASQGFEAAYVSPDGSREVFTGPAAGDSAEDCCLTQLRIRPAATGGAATGAEGVVALRLPDGVPSMALWDGGSDRGTWGVWWENEENVLLDAEIGDHSYLVRCSADVGACERVFDLGSNRSSGVLYMPDWERQWGFARLPLAR